LAGRADEFKWLTSIVRWVEQAVQDKQQVADPPPPPEPPAVSSRLNNIYLGRISVIEPALQAAFVDYGAARHGFLSFNDIHPSCYQTPEGDQQRLTDGPSLPVDDPDEVATKIGAPSENELNVADMIKRGQVVLAQISKEPSGNRGARVTTYIELVGRFLVLMPNEAGVRALSKDILHAEERKRLAAMIERLSVPEGMGIIVREVGASRSEAEIKSDLADLVARWDTLRDLSLKSTPPALVYDAASHLPTRAADPA
jgi:ribonuclease E